MHEIKKKYLLLSSVNTSVPYPGKSVYFLITHFCVDCAP